MSDRDFGELVWENGQILTRVLSSTGSHENHRWSSFSLHDSKAQVEVGWDTSMVKRGRLLDKEFPGHTKMDPHPNYPRQDSFKKDCHTELLAKFSGSILNDEVAYTISGHDEQLVPSSDNQNFKQGNACNLFSGEPQLTRPKGGQICESSLQQGQASSPYIRSRDGSSKIPVSTSGLSNSMMRQPEQEQDADPDNRMGSMNFSYFLKLAAVDKAKAQNIDAARATTSPGLSRLKESKSDYANGTNPFRLRPIGPPTGSVTPKLLPQPVASSLREPLSNGHCKAVGHEVAFGNTASANQIPKPNSSFAASIVKGKKGKPYAEKSVEPLLASSSTCSREASNYPSYSLKSKCQESEESEHPSQSFEEEPRRAEGAMSTRGGSAGSKRNRSAEGHSLSEKRRRDRINKKMRSLQELIPNCKKVDKISILDEAIDYLKTLQLQVQVMSMGAGMCMAPVMIPAVLQQIQAAHLPHFSPMGMGMGIRMGMGMGMGLGLGLGLGLGCSPEQFPSPPILGAAALSGIAGTAPQMLGHPGQVLPMSLSSAPFIPLHAGSLTQSVLVPSVPKDIHPVGHPGSSPSSN